MQRIGLKGGVMALAAMAGVITAGPSLAEKPSWAGQGKATKHEGKDHKKGEEARTTDGASLEIRFGDDYRHTVRDYYAQQARGGKCPPGLAKKNNGCMPPGQARKWQRGQALPRDVVMYDLPHELVVRIGVPPAGHRYVRVAADILLIAAGTNMVVDAIADLGL